MLEKEEIKYNKKEFKPALKFLDTYMPDLIVTNKEIQSLKGLFFLSEGFYLI